MRATKKKKLAKTDLEMEAKAEAVVCRHKLQVSMDRMALWLLSWMGWRKLLLIPMFTRTRVTCNCVVASWSNNRTGLPLFVRIRSNSSFFFFFFFVFWGSVLTASGGRGIGLKSEERGSIVRAPFSFHKSRHVSGNLDDKFERRGWAQRAYCLYGSCTSRVSDSSKRIPDVSSKQTKYEENRTFRHSRM